MRKEIKITALGLLLLTFLNCKKNNDRVSDNSLPRKYDNYIKQIDKNVTSLSPERKAKRKEWLNELKKNPVFITLVDSNIVHEKYLPTLNAISEAIKNTYSEDGESLFGISENTAIDLENSDNGKDKMDFVIKTASLSMKINGGMPETIIRVFENYRKKFNFYGNTGDLTIDNSGKKIRIEKPYNLTYTFALIDPSNQNVLDAIFESVDKGISQWNEESTVIYHYGYMSLKKEYMKHLKEVYPESGYLLDVDFEIIPEELYAEYDANEVAADEKYKGKKFAITGNISEIGKDIINKPYISFRVDYLKNVICFFSKDEIKRIANLNKGDEITIVGKCEGLTLTNVVIKNCEIH